MARLRLPNVTLVMLYGLGGKELFKQALNDTLELIEPYETIILSADKHAWNGHPPPSHDWTDLPVKMVEIPVCKSAKEAMHIFWYTLPQMVKSTHTIHIEWDGWIINPDMWRDEYLNYDYIGAPWTFLPREHPYRVGNGLGLRSMDLMRYVAKNPWKYPLPDAEDDGLCKYYRPHLEHEMGFRWPHEDLARQFSWERGDYPGPTFMFHGVFNWWQLLTPEQIEWRKKLADSYVSSKSTWHEFINHQR